MALRSCAVPGSQRPRHTVGPVHKKRPDMWPWSRPCTPRLGPRGRPTPQPWAGVSQRGHLHNDCRGAGRVEPGSEQLLTLGFSLCLRATSPPQTGTPRPFCTEPAIPSLGEVSQPVGGQEDLALSPSTLPSSALLRMASPARGQPHLHADSPQAFTLPTASPAAVGKPPPDKALPGLFPGEQVPLGWGPGGGEGLLCNSACALPAPPPAPRRPHPGALVQAVSPGLRPSPLSVPDSASISKGSADRLSHRWHLQESPWRRG